MTTLTATDPAAAAPAMPTTSERRTPFIRLVRMELRKQLDTRAGKGLLIAIVVVSAAVVALQLWFNQPENLTWASLSDGASLGQALLLPLIGIMAATSEWSQRTALVTFTLEPRRTLVNLAKLTSAVWLGVIVMVATYAISAVLNVVGMVAFDGDGSWSLSGGALLGMLLGVLLLVIQGVGFGLALLNTPVAIVAYLVLPTLFTILAAFPSLAGVGEWLDLNTTMLPLIEWNLDGGSLARLATSAAVWILLPLGFGLWRTAHREVA
ncbi:hypothetical protein GCM10023169_31530 [Georgenia halophila]|uniref:ABC transporter permease n=1 Tax=Georgenia halophila TaxID=620889 RepID=A0ABP8LJA1_9MICO